ncbi:MAG: FAD:protein FMN transferase [Bryobacteraceae bacterium]|nr:FAD:protein FMN transferase [Bryobacteraceae bacterium]
MRIRNKHMAVVALALIAGLLGWRLTRPAAQPLRLERPLMGTLWTIEVMHSGMASTAAEAIAKAFAEVERIEGVMSEWRPETPVSALNRSAGGPPVEVPEELRAMLERAIAFGVKSGGAFDVTWRGMGGLWRFDESFRVPSREEVEAARRRVDYRGLRVEGNRARLERAGMAVGLGGIAKGYAVDRASMVLTDAGFVDHLVAGAGDIRAAGSRNGEPWRIGVQDPRRERGKLLGRVLMRDGAISTSGDYERFRMVGGIRYHHLIDPRTGWPAALSASATVLAGSAERADALATAIFVLGPEEGLKLAQAEGVDAMIVSPDGRRHATGGFRARFEPGPASN